MSRFLIEGWHGPDTVACARVVHVFLSSRSHFLSNADWGCQDGVHSAWIIADADSKADALALVPPAFRRQAKVVRLNKFTMEQIDQIMRCHRGKTDRPGPAEAR